MKFSAAALVTLLASTGLAAPADKAVSMMATSSQWTIQGLNRVCDAADKTCTWNFKVFTGSGTATGVKYIVKSAAKASQANGGPLTFGDFTITSGWSGQFGPGNGFTTLSVVSKSKKQIVWPAYTDKQIAGGAVVKPDQAYTPVILK